MQQISIKTNIIFNVIRVGVKMMFPILILPIITRNLGVEKFGLIEYATSIISYFIIFSSLGIHNYGSREVSIHRQSNQTQSKIIQELFSLLIIISTISLFAYLLIISFNTDFKSEKDLYYILGIQIFFTITLSGEWIYEGLENQKFITYRTLAIQICYIILIFFFIKAPKDYHLYALITSLVNVVVVFINLFFIRTHIKIRKIKFKELAPIRHLRFVLITFAAQISSLIYTQSAITIIGIIDTMTSVGYFSVAVKFFRISTALWSAFAGSLIPRLSFYWMNKEYDLYKNFANNLLKYLILISTFLVVLNNALAKPIIMIFASEAYYHSIFTLKILSFGILGSALSYFFGIIILYSQKSDKKFLYASLFTSILNVSLNFIVITLTNYNGAAIITVLTEFICFSFLWFRYRKNYLGITLISKDNIKSIFSGTVCWLMVTYAISSNNNYFSQISIGLLFGGIIYILLLRIVKHSVIMQISSKFFIR